MLVEIMFLKVIAKRLQDCFRRHDIVARFGGDEFVVLIGNPISTANLESLLNRVVATISQAIEFQEQSVRVGVSIGIARHLGETFDIDNLLERADFALYQAKNKGKGCFIF